MASGETVYVFRGIRSQFAGAVFSSLDRARAWIRTHEVSGMVTAYDVDDPAFDKQELDPAKMSLTPEERPSKYDPERFCDGSQHWHFYLGQGPGDAGYDDALRQWDEAFDARNKRQDRRR